MLTEAERKLVYDGLPTTYTIDSVAFTVQKVYKNQWKEDYFPAIVLNYTRAVPVHVPFDYVREIDNVSRDGQDTVLATSSLSYSLSVGYITSITAVAGTRGGIHFDFDVSKITLGDDANTITFTATERPDAGTNFVVDYAYSMVDTTLGGVYDELLTVNVWAENYNYPSGPATVNGARIANYIAKTLKEYIDYQLQYQSLTGLLIWTFGDVRDLDTFLESRYRYLRQFDVRVRHQESYELIEPPIHDADFTMVVTE